MVFSDKGILLVEDNADDEVLTLRALKRNKIENPVVVARDGEEAVELLMTAARGNRPLPQVVLLDLNLPVLSGLDVLRQIRAEQRLRALPVVILTSSREEEDVLNSYALGANSYVRKPVAADEFSAAVQTLGRFWLVLNEVALPRS